jgi:hypothetical protein
MKSLVKCRRSIIALTGIAACVIITYLTHSDTSLAIAGIVSAIAGANAAQATFSKRALDK